MYVRQSLDGTFQRQAIFESHEDRYDLKLLLIPTASVHPSMLAVRYV